MAFAIKRPTSSDCERLNICAVSPNTHLCLGHWTLDSWHTLELALTRSPRTPEVPSRVQYQKSKPNCTTFHRFSTIFSNKWAGNTSVYSMKSMFWTNEKFSLMVAWSSSVSISCFKVQSSIGHLVWFFDSENSILSGANLCCPLRKASRKKVAVLLDFVHFS